MLGLLLILLGSLTLQQIRPLIFPAVATIFSKYP